MDLQGTTFDGSGCYDHHYWSGSGCDGQSGLLRQEKKKSELQSHAPLIGGRFVRVRTLARMRTHHTDVHTHTCTCTPLYTRTRRRAHAPLVARRFIRVLILFRAPAPAPPLAFPPSSITGTAAVVDNRRVRHHLHTTRERMSVCLYVCLCMCLTQTYTNICAARRRRGLDR